MFHYQVLSRQFPFHRGIFEDKVSNLWYGLSVVFDYRKVLTINLIINLSICLTLLLISPIAFNLLTKTFTARRAILSLVNCSLAFFLASYQVHEKSLLLTLVPALLLFPLAPMMLTWFQVVGTFTMFPLLLKDGLMVPYFICIFLFIVVTSFVRSHGSLFVNSIGCKVDERIETFKRVCSVLSSVGMILLHIGYEFIKPPGFLVFLYISNLFYFSLFISFISFSYSHS